MATLAAQPGLARTAPQVKGDARALTVGIGAVMLAHLWLALTKSINWDEFHHFDQIRQLASGTLVSPLQTIHARLFAWLLDLPGDTTVQIRAARLVMLACTMTTAAALYKIAARFVSHRAALLTSLAYLSGGYVVAQGTAFRTDPLAAALLMGALWVLACRPMSLRAALVAGLLVGAAGLVTIKAAFYLPAFAAIIWLRMQNDRTAAVRTALTVLAVALATFVGLLAWHSVGLAAPPMAATGDTVASTGRTVFSEGFAPQWRWVVLQIALAPHCVWLLWQAPAAWREAHFDRATRFGFAGLMLPLLSLLVYRNAYPYFFVFLLPPVMIAASPAMARLLERWRGPTLAWAMALLAVGIAGAQSSGEVLEGQRRTIAAVHRMVPVPVAYFDFAGTLGDYPRALPFMPSGWGLAEYRRRGTPQFRQAMAARQIPLLIANHPVLAAAMRGDRPSERLLDPDADALRTNYIPHWGRVFAAGKRFEPQGLPTVAEFLVPGTYTLEGAPLRIDGRLLRPGETVIVERGVHSIAGGSNVAATLRWGDHLAQPTFAPSEAQPFDEF